METEKAETFVFIRSYKMDRGLSRPIIVLWSCGKYNLETAKKQYPDNVVLVYSKGYKAAKSLAEQYFFTR